MMLYSISSRVDFWYASFLLWLGYTFDSSRECSKFFMFIYLFWKKNKKPSFFVETILVF